MSQKSKDQKDNKNIEKDVIVEISSQHKPEKNSEENIKSESDKKSGKKKKEKTVSIKKFDEVENKLLNQMKAFEEMKDKYYRLAAEFDNFKKRTNKEFENILKYAGEKVLKEIVPIFDDLSRALENESEKEKNENSGLTMIFKKFEKSLKDLEVEPIKSLGEAFDPDFHHALMVREEEGVEPDRVVEEFEKGYKYKDRVLKHAKVVVSK